MDFVANRHLELSAFNIICSFRFSNQFLSVKPTVIGQKLSTVIGKQLPAAIGQNTSDENGSVSSAGVPPVACSAYE